VDAGGLRSVADDPNFKQAVMDLKVYLNAAGSAGLVIFKYTADPQVATIAAGMTGELASYKETYDELVKAYRAGALPQASTDVALDEVA
jgi:hypothetical protein